VYGRRESMHENGGQLRSLLLQDR